MIEVKLNRDLGSKFKLTIESNDEHDFEAIYASGVLGINSKCNGTLESSNPTHIRRIYMTDEHNTRIDHDSLVEVGCIKDV